MNFDVVVTCAVTGAGDTVGRHPGVPVTPRQIADAAIEAAKAGAAVAHIHVRDPETGQGSRDPELFRQVVDMVRSSGTDVVINLTAGMGGDWVPSEEDPSMPGPGTDMIGPVRKAGSYSGSVAGNLLIGLRHTEFRQRRHDLHLNPTDPAQDG